MWLFIGNEKIYIFMIRKNSLPSTAIRIRLERKLQFHFLVQQQVDLPGYMSLDLLLLEADLLLESQALPIGYS